MANKRLLNILYGLNICIGLAIIIFGTIYLVKEWKKRNDYDELTYYDFKISYDDDNYCYEIFTEDKMYIIRESQLDVQYDDETYIVIFDNNYKWQYNKAILVIGVKGNEE